MCILTLQGHKGAVLCLLLLPNDFYAAHNSFLTPSTDSGSSSGSSGGSSGGSSSGSSSGSSKSDGSGACVVRLSVCSSSRSNGGTSGSDGNTGKEQEDKKTTKQGDFEEDLNLESGSWLVSGSARVVAEFVFHVH